MIKTTYRSKFTIGMAWLGAPLFLGTGLLRASTAVTSDLDVMGLVIANSSGLLGLLYVWTLMKRRVPIVAISHRTLDLGATFPFQRPRSLPIDEIHGVALEWRTLVVETRAGTVRFLLLGLAANELRPILAMIQRVVAERRASGAT